MLFGCFDHLDDLKRNKQQVVLKRSFSVVVVAPSWTMIQLLHLCFLKRSHPTAEHGATVATDFQEDLFVIP